MSRFVLNLVLCSSQREGGGELRREGGGVGVRHGNQGTSHREAVRSEIMSMQWRIEWTLWLNLIAPLLLTSPLSLIVSLSLSLSLSYLHDIAREENLLKVVWSLEVSQGCFKCLKVCVLSLCVFGLDNYDIITSVHTNMSCNANIIIIMCRCTHTHTYIHMYMHFSFSSLPYILTNVQIYTLWHHHPGTQVHRYTSIHMYTQVHQYIAQILLPHTY